MSTIFFDGYVVGEPDFKPVGEKTCIKFSIACRAKFKKDKEDNTKKHCSFFNIEYWPYEWKEGVIKEEVLKIRKGAHVCFEAEPLQDRWEDNEGNKREKVFFNINGYVNEIVPREKNPTPGNQSHEGDGFEDDIPF